MVPPEPLRDSAVYCREVEHNYPITEITLSKTLSALADQCFTKSFCVIRLFTAARMNLIVQSLKLLCLKTLSALAD